MTCCSPVNEFFVVQDSERWAGKLEIKDTLNKMVWGPFNNEEEASIQLLKLEQLAELDHITDNVEDLERIIWEEITIDSESGDKVKKMSDRLQKLVDSQLECLKREQRNRQN